MSDENNPSLSLDCLDIERSVSYVITRRLRENTLEPAATLGSLGWIFSPKLKPIIATYGPKYLS